MWGTVLYVMWLHDNIVVSKVDNKENPTNKLTNALSMIKFEHCLDLAGICYWIGI